MHSLRRTEHDTRIEIMPMIDVIFLLLTFFIYAMVLMVRAEMLPVEMQAFTSGEPATPAPAVTISLDADGGLFLDRVPVAIESLVERIEETRSANPETVVYLAAEARGTTDRLPTFLSVYDRLALAGIDIRLVGRPDDQVDPAALHPDGP